MCFGFGSALAIVRDHALIPHDDDLDIIVGFEPDEASSIADGLTAVERHLRGLGYEVGGPSYDAHRHVRLPGRKAGRRVRRASSRASRSRGTRRRAAGSPGTWCIQPSSAPLLGVRCRIPAQPEAYLERMYGTGWRVPDPYFNHPWNVSEYADIRGTAATPIVDGAADAGHDPDAS